MSFGAFWIINLLHFIDFAIKKKKTRMLNNEITSCRLRCGSMTAWDSGGANCSLLTCTLVHWLLKFPVQQATQHKQQQLLLYMHGWKDRQVCVFLGHKGSSVGLYPPSHLIPSARHELPYSSFLSVPLGPCLILPIFPVAIFLSLSMPLAVLPLSQLSLLLQ